jgi:hypothetical protein
VPTANWKRLGELLVRRRIELDPRYSNRQLFAAERGINYRTVSDVERGRRDNYEGGTVTALEVAYAVAPGSIGRALAGGELEPLPGPARPEPGAPPNPFASVMPDEPEGDEAWTMFPDPADRPLRAIWRQPLPYQKRVEKVAELRDWAKAALRPPGQESAGLPSQTVTFPPLILI